MPVPEIYAYCGEEGWMLIEDVGGPEPGGSAWPVRGAGETAAGHRRVLAVLVHQQLEGIKGFDPAWCFDTPAVTRHFSWSGSAVNLSGLP